MTPVGLPVSVSFGCGAPLLSVHRGAGTDESLLSQSCTGCKRCPHHSSKETGKHLSVRNCVSALVALSNIWELSLDPEPLVACSLQNTLTTMSAVAGLVGL